MALKPITVEDILETLSEQERQEVLQDDFKIPLELYLKGFNKDHDNLQSLATFIVSKLRKFAKDRVAVRDEIQRNPDIVKTPLNGPILIIGMPRTGTTMLQRLLSCDSQFLSPMLWELIEIVPAGRPQNWTECERYKKAQECEEFKVLLDGFADSTHFMRLELHEECFWILRRYFLDVMDTILPTMKDWRDFVWDCPAEHLENAYDYYKKCLQCIFYGNTEKTMLLKSCIHLLYLEMYRKVFPNVKFIYPYRNMKDMVGSFTSIAHQFMQKYGFDDKHGIAQESLKYYKMLTLRAIQFFKTIPQDSFMTIGYSEMVKNPIETVHKIYSKFGLKLTPGAEEKMKSHLADKQANTSGKHKYNIADFGITEEQLHSTLTEYVEYFKDGPEKL